MRNFDLLIVGGGASGTLAAAHVLKASSDPIRVGLFERAGVFGQGPAYGTDEPLHLLNVPADRMSAWPDDPGHFVRYCGARGLSLTGAEFLPRSLYGAYLSWVLVDAGSHGRWGAELERVPDEVVDIERRAGGFAVRTRSGARHFARRVLLATGPSAPEPLDVAWGAAPGYARYEGYEGYVPTAWDTAWLSQVKPDDEVLLVGTGLTAVDVVVSLLVRGHRGPITAVSRHGLLPMRHTGVSRRVDITLGQIPPRARSLLRALRAAVRDAAGWGIAWQEVVDAFRWEVAERWQRLPLEERRRFLRHLRAYWDVHRHRVAPEIADWVKQAEDEGHLRVMAGRLREIAPHGRAAVCTVHRRGQGNEQLTARWIVNCTSPANPLRVGEPLMRALEARGLVREDVLGLGVETRGGEVVDASGRAQSDLLAIGCLRRAELWETTAIPGIRQQAAEVARRVVGEVRAVEEARES